jgi:hypothetical protein
MAKFQRWLAGRRVKRTKTFGDTIWVLYWPDRPGARGEQAWKKLAWYVRNVEYRAVGPGTADGAADGEEEHEEGPAEAGAGTPPPGLTGAGGDEARETAAAPGGVPPTAGGVRAVWAFALAVLAAALAAALLAGVALG